MRQLQFLSNISKRQWILLACLVLIAYLARFALAQDSSIVEETATPAAVSEIEPAPADPVVEPTQVVEAVVVPEPTQSLELIASPEPVLVAPTLPEVEFSATADVPVETPVLPELIVATPFPEDSAVIVVDEAAVTPDVVVEIQATALPPEATAVTVDSLEASPVIPTADILLPSHLSGSIQSALVGISATVTIAGADTQQTVAVQSDSSFSLDVLPGDYQLIITAQSHLPYVLNVSVTDQAVVLPTITLINTQMSADILRLIVQNFGMPVSSGQSIADVNGDGVINVYDLSIAGSSFR